MDAASTTTTNKIKSHPKFDGRIDGLMDSLLHLVCTQSFLNIEKYIKEYIFIIKWILKLCKFFGTDFFIVFLFSSGIKKYWAIKIYYHQIKENINIESLKLSFDCIWLQVFSLHLMCTQLFLNVEKHIKVCNFIIKWVPKL